VNNQKLKEVIEDRYGKIARGGSRLSAAPPAGRLRPINAWPWVIPPRGLQLISGLAVLGVGCGNPTALARSSYKEPLFFKEIR